ncbi:MAG: thiol peroxidase [Phycisphaerales bacterium]|nr:thiol peroxidase [Phycisphaerales bacterium]
MSRSCTLKGNPLSLEGPELQVGDAAPDATLKKNLVEDFKLGEAAGRARIYSVVPSLDTPVCAEQTRRFNKEAAGLANVDFYTISVDLPVAMSRFCGAESIDTEKVKVLSDHKDVSFGKAYGTLIPDLRVNSRAVFVVGADDKIKYAEYVPEVAEHPNYEAVINCAREVAS